MKTINGSRNRFLEIDLTRQQYSDFTIDDSIRTLFLGGKGVGLKLLYDRLLPGSDPLGPDNIIVFTTGVLMGTGAPNSARFSAVTKSPLTGLITASSCGGPFGMALKKDGWDGVIIRGRSKSPVLLRIDSKGVEFINADKIWGLDSQESQREIVQIGDGSVVIGPAGENRVKYANIVSGNRYLGRGGMGAVFGSKMLKAVVATGRGYRIQPVQKNRFKKTIRKANTYINRNRMTAHLYRKYGTSANVEQCNQAQILPVRNFLAGSHREAGKISGQFYEENFNSSNHSCKQCPILCGHQGEFSISGSNGTTKLSIPEYESIGLLGSNLEVFEAEKIAL